MGCFSFICKECGQGINSTSFTGENVRLSLLEKGKVIEEMQGQYDSYGGVFGTEKDPKDKSLTDKTSFEWKKPWNEVCDLMFNRDNSSGISAVHVQCLGKDADTYVPTEISDGDPDQGWNRVKRIHLGECEIYHKIL